MNLVLFEPHELGVALPRTDARAEHILKVLRRSVGQTFDAGVVGGPLGKASVVEIGERALKVAFTAGAEPLALPLRTLIVGLPRPATARDILRDATTLGVQAIHFVETERTDPNYAASKLWIDGEWRQHLLTGAAQAFDTRLPEISWCNTLEHALAGASGRRLALDNYEAETHLGNFPICSNENAQVLAIGPERGWGPQDRAVLRNAGCTLVHLGERVLRVETAVVAALAILAAHEFTRKNGLSGDPAQNLG